MINLLKQIIKIIKSLFSKIDYSGKFNVIEVALYLVFSFSKEKEISKYKSVNSDVIYNSEKLFRKQEVCLI